MYWAALVLVAGLLVLLLGIRAERADEAQTSDAYHPPAASAHVASSRTVDSTAAPVALPALATSVLLGGCALSALLADLWPLHDDGESILLVAVGKDMDEPGAVFNWPLFILGAGPSIIAAAVLYAAGAVVDELRKARFILTLTATDNP